MGRQNRSSGKTRGGVGVDRVGVWGKYCRVAVEVGYRSRRVWR